MFNVLLLLQLLSICAAVPKIFTAEEYAGACVGMIVETYAWAPCKGLRYLKLTNCGCKQTSAIESAISCIDQLTEQLDEVEREKKRREAYEYLINSKCRIARLNMTTLESYHNKSLSLEPYEGDKPMDKVGKWKANKAFKPDMWECKSAVLAYYSYDQMEPRTTRVCSGTMAYWGGVLLIRFVVHWFAVLFPRTLRVTNIAPVKWCRRHFTLPALLHNRHSQPAFITRYFPFYLPTRLESLITAGFVALHLGFTFGYNPYYKPSYMYNYDNVYLYNQLIAYRTGKMAVFELPLMFMFGGRNNLLQWLTGWSHDTFIVFHKWIARCIAFSTLLHSVAYTVARIHGKFYGSSWRMAYWKWGVAGTVGACAIIFQSFPVFRRLHYEIFLVLHILFAILFIVAGYYHLETMLEEPLGYYYATFAVWGFDRTARLVRVLISGPFAKAEVELHGDDILVFTISYSGLWKPRPGEYAFVHIVQPSFFWESHPFTLPMGIRAGEENKLKLFGRVKDGMTKRAKHRAVRNGGKFMTRLWIDGPYGPYHHIKEFNEALLVAGGVGITAAFSHIHGLLRDKNTKTSKIKLVWAIRDDSAFEWFKDQLDYMKESGRVEISIFMGGRNVDPVLEQEKLNVDEETGDTRIMAVSESSNFTTTSSSSSSNISKDQKKSSRQQVYVSSATNDLLTVTTAQMDVKKIVREVIHEAQGSLAVFCCGTVTMTDNTRYAVANGLMQSPHYIEYFEESYSW